TILSPVSPSSNTTQIGPVLLASNATILHPIPSGIVYANDTLTVLVNATILHPIPSGSNATNLVQPIQNLTQSWNFTSLNGKVGHVTTTNNTLQLQGTGYLAQKINATNNIQQLTLSAWVKPDYSQGSPQFTIISKEDTFMLTINNNIPPTKIATFSVFDGIRWQTVQSTSVIPEQWTHIAATFDPSSISIYVNGTKESTVPVSGVSSIAINGKIVNKTIDQLSSDSDVVIGASIDTTSQSSSSQFSGLIKDVSMYNSVLSESQIQQLYASGQGILGTNLIPAQINLTSTNATSVVTNSTSPVSFSDSNSTNLSEIVYANDALTVLVNATNSTGMPIILSMNTTKQSYLLTESPEFNFQYYSDAAVKKSGKLVANFNGTGQSNSTIQSNGWRSSHESIAFKITAPDGKEITLKTTVKKIRDGKFDITLSSLKSAKPGMYTITAILTKNGKTYTTTDQYMWGLVSLNTQKSIYKPGEVANFTIVVLDNQGHSVCNSNIVMNIHSPTSSTATLRSGNGITPGNQCGLYNAQYVPQFEGNYTIDMVAQNPSGTAS
ncbi:MAG: LamG domain-containing protein, partial [Nitrosotalea sp.]